MKNLQAMLNYLLKHENLSPNALAVKLQLPAPTIHRLTTGDVQDPRISTLTLIADYFGVTFEQLLGRAPLGKKFLNRRK